eukprot:353813-Rhodomonas_salina.3
MAADSHREIVGRTGSIAKSARHVDDILVAPYAVSVPSVAHRVRRQTADFTWKSTSVPGRVGPRLGSGTSIPDVSTGHTWHRRVAYCSTGLGIEE